MKDGVFKIDSDMINLIGCSKENFYKLLELMQYKRAKIKQNNEEYFQYKPKKMKDSKEEYFIYKPNFLKNRIKKDKNKSTKDNPFGKLSEFRFR